MPFDNVIDIGALTAPISDTNPGGEDIREDRSPTSDYYSIKDARNNARAAERSSMFDDDVDLITPWRAVVELAPNILKNRSKDLEVAAWYTEALIRLHGIPGLRDGLELIQSFVDTYWDGLYPQPDEDGLETKVAPITGLNGDGGDGTLMAPIRNAGLTVEGDYGSFNLWQYQKARDNDRIADEDEKASRIDNLGFSLQDIVDTINGSPVTFYIDMIDTLQQTIDCFKAINEKLKTYCGHDAPPHSNISQLLEEVLRSIRFLSKDRVEAAQASAAAELSESDSTDDSPAATLMAQAINGTAVASGAIQSREDALKRLQDVADYFRQNEPHTPLAPGIERLIDWGRMTVAELMMELLPEDHSRSAFAQLTGVKMDGSDTKKYVAPPTPTAKTTTANDTTTPAPATAEPEQTSAW
ncbi:MAG: type VI secretion system protein TssA [Cellvibrionaceae bacterium]|nr:type VI secretion system protein TssA [Cellvibrionaceae bacterium]|tara:strand:+ start:47539 stop:48777 length:1239 start_codon:yes stop_codon:yes gene_type:complete